jgi:hypothetical protein
MWVQCVADYNSKGRVMTQDEIIEMAKQAHQKLVTEVYVGHMKQLDPWTIELLKIFAKLVEKHYRVKDREDALAYLRMLHDSFSLASKDKP